MILHRLNHSENVDFVNILSTQEEREKIRDIRNERKSKVT